jgi:hypothetical protein
MTGLLRHVLVVGLCPAVLVAGVDGVEDAGGVAGDLLAAEVVALGGGDVGLAELVGDSAGVGGVAESLAVFDVLRTGSHGPRWPW